MTIEKLDLSGLLGTTPLFKTLLCRTVLFKIKHKINEIIDWINNHEKNILPRFKEEILMCLEDDEFRNSFFNTLFPESARKGFILYEHVDINKTIDKLKEAEDDLEKAIEPIVYMGIGDITLGNIEDLLQAYKNWKGARGK